MISIPEAALDDALIRELCTGRQLMDALEHKREIEAAAIAAASRKMTPGKHFRHVAEIPQREYLLMANKYGEECWQDREFVRDFQRLEPTMAVHKL
jgi:hypothetical protein